MSDQIQRLSCVPPTVPILNLPRLVVYSSQTLHLISNYISHPIPQIPHSPLCKAAAPNITLATHFASPSNSSPSNLLSQRLTTLSVAVIIPSSSSPVIQALTPKQAP